MSQEPDRFAEDGAVDERIRRLATDLPCREHASEIASRVLGKVRRRQRYRRAGYAAAVIAVLITVGLASPRFFDHTHVGSQLASETTGVEQTPGDQRVPGPVDFEPGFLTAPPPVMSLGVIAEDQFVTLNCLEALAEEAE